MKSLSIAVLGGNFAVAMPKEEKFTSFSSFFAYTKTENELSLVCRESEFLDCCESVEAEYSLFCIGGKPDFYLTGKIANIASVIS